MRTREEQVNDLVEALWDGMCRKDAEKSASMIIDEAMALGVAEQRRKDVEACCPVHQVWNDLDAKWEDCPEGEEDWRWEHADECDQRIFYTHPANVATLEAALLDPASVHQNMLRGTIAKPSWDQIKHLYPTEFAAREAENEALKISRAHSDGVRNEKQKRINTLEMMIADLREAKKQAFNQGYLIACCNVANMHNEPSIACDVLAECDLTEDDIKVADLSEYDATALSEIRRSRGDRDPIRAALTREGGV